MSEHKRKVVSSGAIARNPVTAGTGTSMQVLIGTDEAPNYAMRKFIMEPGGGIPRHKNLVEHEQYVLKGSATVGIGAEEFAVKAGDVLYIPAGVPHWYQAAPGESFEFLCLVPNAPDELTFLDS